MDNILTDLQNYSFEKEDEKTISEIKMKFNELEWEEISKLQVRHLQVNLI